MRQAPQGTRCFLVEGDEDTAYGLRLLDQLQNTILIACEAKVQASSLPGDDVAAV